MTQPQSQPQPQPTVRAPSNRGSRTAALMLAAAASVSLGGCGTLIKAVKGELTPLGATSVRSGDVSSLRRALATEDDPQKLAVAFSDLTSIYLYKCLNDPTKVPKDGKADIRTQAGDALVAGMQARLSTRAPNEDPAADSLAERANALSAEVSSKCDADKVAKLDSNGRLAEAATLTTVEGRSARAETLASALDESLEAAVADESKPNAVLAWATTTCPAVLPKEGYCLPHALQVLHVKERWDTIVGSFLHRNGEAMLAILAETVGQDAVVEEVKTALLGNDPPTGVRSRSAMDSLTGYLRANDAWGDCNAHQDAYRAKLRGNDRLSAEWAIDMAVSDRCADLGGDLIKALASDSMGVRAKAVWAIGELDIRKGKRHVERLQWSDPGFSEGCYCYPVRDAARSAFNKLEIQAS